MGNIRPRYIKSVCEDILRIYPEKVTDKFELNKLLVEEVTDVNSKTLRNKIAGLLVRMKKKSKRIITHPKGKKERGPRKKKADYTSYNYSRGR